MPSELFTSVAAAKSVIKEILYFEDPAWDAMIAQLTSKSADPLAALEIIKVITEVCELVESATWSTGCERQIWHALAKDREVHFSHAAGIDIDQKKRLVRLQKLAGGWWQWDDELSDLPIFMTTKEWRAHVQEK